MLFCHITSRVKTDSHQDLLQEKGGTGFPHLVYMDADGNVLAKHEGARSVEGFKSTSGKAKKFLELKAKAEKGDKQAQIELFIMQMELGHLKLAEARKRFDELKELSKEQKERIEGMIVELEVQDVLQGVKGDNPKEKQEAGRKFAEMQKAGRVPAGEREMPPFWIFIMDYAEAEKDAALFEVALKVLEKKFSDNPRVEKFLDDRKAVLERLKGEKTGDK